MGERRSLFHSGGTGASEKALDLQKLNGRAGVGVHLQDPDPVQPTIPIGEALEGKHISFGSQLGYNIFSCWADWLALSSY